MKMAMRSLPSRHGRSSSVEAELALSGAVGHLLVWETVHLNRFKNCLDVSIPQPTPTSVIPAPTFVIPALTSVIPARAGIQIVERNHTP